MNKPVDCDLDDLQQARVNIYEAIQQIKLAKICVARRRDLRNATRNLEDQAVQTMTMIELSSMGLTPFTRDPMPEDETKGAPTP